MLKWVILTIVVAIVVILLVRIINVMLKTEKESKKNDSNTTEIPQDVEYKPESSAIDLHSSNTTILTDMSAKPSESTSQDDNFSMPSTSFVDDADDDFEDFSAYARGGKGRRRPPEGFDLDGELADEYIPDSPEFSYLPRRQKAKKQPLNKALNELPTELKVLMLSDIFDRKFFD